MDILKKLRSQSGVRTALANREVAGQCLEDPELRGQVVAGLGARDAAMVADCAEVLTMVARMRPDLVAPYVSLLAPLLAHKNTRVRWEAMHATALIAALAPETIERLLPTLSEMASRDGSIIVRDYAVNAIANYAGSSLEAAQRAYPLLRDAVHAWNGKHARYALAGLAKVAHLTPEHGEELAILAGQHWDDGRAVVRKAAKALLRSTRSGSKATRRE